MKRPLLHAVLIWIYVVGLVNFAQIQSQEEMRPKSDSENTEHSEPQDWLQQALIRSADIDPAQAPKTLGNGLEILSTSVSLGNLPLEPQIIEVPFTLIIRGADGGPTDLTLSLPPDAPTAFSLETTTISAPPSEIFEAHLVMRVDTAILESPSTSDGIGRVELLISDTNQSTAVRLWYYQLVTFSVIKPSICAQFYLTGESITQPATLFPGNECSLINQTAWVPAGVYDMYVVDSVPIAGLGRSKRRIWYLPGIDLTQPREIDVRNIPLNNTVAFKAYDQWNKAIVPNSSASWEYEYMPFISGVFNWAALHENEANYSGNAISAVQTNFWREDWRYEFLNFYRAFEGRSFYEIRSTTTNATMDQTQTIRFADEPYFDLSINQTGEDPRLQLNHFANIGYRYNAHQNIGLKHEAGTYAATIHRNLLPENPNIRPSGIHARERFADTDDFIQSPPLLNTGPNSLDIYAIPTVHNELDNEAEYQESLPQQTQKLIVHPVYVGIQLQLTQNGSQWSLDYEDSYGVDHSPNTPTTKDYIRDQRQFRVNQGVQRILTSGGGTRIGDSTKGPLTQGPQEFGITDHVPFFESHATIVQTLNFDTERSDNTPPAINGLRLLENGLRQDLLVDGGRLEVDITDNSFVSEVEANYRANGTASWLPLNVVRNVDTFIVTIPDLPVGDYDLQILARDGEDNQLKQESSPAFRSGNFRVSLTQTNGYNWCQGGQAQLSTSVTAGTATSYQWFKDNVAIEGATTPELTVTMDETKAGFYQCMVSDGVNTISSGRTKLNFMEMAISDSPTDSQVCDGGDFLAGVTASGAGLSYQWRHNGVVLDNQDHPILSLYNVATAQTGTYQCTVTDQCGNSLEITPFNLTISETIIVTDLEDITICTGETAELRVLAQGEDLLYTWYRNGQLSRHFRSASIPISGNSQQVSTWQCVISGACGQVTTDEVTVTINQDFTIEDSNIYTSVCSGESAELSITTSGENVSYQWMYGEEDIPGATEAQLIIDQVGEENTGWYQCRVSADCGQVTIGGNVGLRSEFHITSQPEGITLCAGNNYTLRVGTSGSVNSLQWMKNGVDIPGATSTELEIDQAEAADEGLYQCRVTGNCDEVITEAAEIAVETAPAITQDPLDASACIGGSVTLTMATDHQDEVVYVWYKGNWPISGPTGPQLTLTDVSLEDAGDYFCQVVHPCFNMNTAVATITINGDPAIIGQPEAVTACAGSPVSFTTTATGTNPGYQWYFNGKAIAGGNSGELLINSASSANAGDYYCLVTDDCGQVQSQTVPLVINPGPNPTLESIEPGRCIGETVTLRVTTTDQASSYQWHHNGQAIPGAVTAELTLANLQAEDAGSYHCEVSGDCDELIASDTVQLAVRDFTAAVTPNGVSQGLDPITLSASQYCACDTDLSYTWRRLADGVQVGTGPQLTLKPLDQTTSFLLEITDCDGTAQETVTVLVNPNGPDINGDGVNSVQDLLHTVDGWRGNSSYEADNDGRFTILDMLHINTGSGAQGTPTAPTTRAR